MKRLIAGVTAAAALMAPLTAHEVAAFGFGREGPAFGHFWSSAERAAPAPTSPGQFAVGATFSGETWFSSPPTTSEIFGFLCNVATAAAINERDYIVGTLNNSYSTHNLKAYKNASLNTQTNAPFPFTFTPRDSETEIGGFRFGSQYWTGSRTEAITAYDEFDAMRADAFASDAARHYSTPLPDSRSPVNPTIAETSARNGVVSKSTTPFSGVSIVDGDPGSHVDTLTRSSGGALSGTGLSDSNPAAASITTKLQALIFTPSRPASPTETLPLSVSSSAGTSASDSATIVTTINAAPAETSFAAPTGSFTPVNFKGVNISGAEDNYPSPNQFNYLYPQNIELDYFAEKGMGLIRMPVTIRRLQPASYGPLDPAAIIRTDGLIGRPDEPAAASNAAVGAQTNLAAIKRILDHAFTKGMYVIIDLHDYGGIKDTLNGNLTRLIGSDSEGTNQFVDFVTRLTTKFKNYPNVIWGLMNEPHVQSAPDWKNGAVAAVNAIASITTSQLVLIPGSGFDGAHSWTAAGNAAAWAGYTPPAGLQVAFEMHQYLDFNNSGQHTTVVAGYGAIALDLPTSGLATTWARANGFKLFLGETGWSFSDRQSSGGVPSTEGAAVMNYMTTNSDVWMGWSYWLGGSSALYGAWNALSPVPYIFSSVPAGYPTGPFTDAPQMSILTNNLNFLLNRDLDPASNDNDPMWLEKAA
jgi:endoglucanase